MADEIEITPGTGIQIRADDIGGKKVQVIRLDAGDDTTEALIHGSSDNGLEVDVTRIAGVVATLDEDAKDLLQACVKLLGDLVARTPMKDPATERTRILIEAITSGLTLSTVTTVGTVSAVTNVVSAGSLDLAQFMRAGMVLPALFLRDKVTIS